MGFTKDTYQITVQRLTGDGQGGFWWLDYDTNTRTRQLGYTSGGTVETAANLIGRDTFRQLMQGMITNNVALPAKDPNINLEDRIEREMLQAQFQAPALSDSDLQTIANAYDPVEYLVYFGLFILVRRFYGLSLINLQQLADVLIGLGQKNKISRERAETLTANLVSAGDLTAAQRNAFLRRWDNEVDNG